MVAFRDLGKGGVWLEREKEGRREEREGIGGNIEEGWG